jgi:transposase
VILNLSDQSLTFEAELAQDVLEIITVFSARLYGSRSDTNRKLVESLARGSRGLVKILRAFKTELDLNQRQRTHCAQHAGAARFAWNWDLACKIAAYEAGEKTPSAIDLHRSLNALKKTEYSWLYAVSKCAPQEALRNLDRACANFFRRVKAQKAGNAVKAGFPKFKSKRNGRGSFRLTGAIHIFPQALQLPRLGRLRLQEQGYLPPTGVKILSATVSERAGRWYVSVQVELEIPAPQPTRKPIAGVDLGLKQLATVSDGTVFENPRALRRSLQKIKRLQRTVSRRQPGSANRKKQSPSWPQPTCGQLTSARIACIR